MYFVIAERHFITCYDSITVFLLLRLICIVTDRSNAVLVLWIIYVISVLFCYAFMHAYLLMPFGHLLGKG